MTIKDHLKCQKHASRKKAKLSTASSRTQVTFSNVVKAKDMRQDFVLDCVKMCTVADIPLEKTEKVRTFLRKYCSQAGSLPGADQLRTIYVLRLFDLHFAALKELLQDKHVSITADEPKCKPSAQYCKHTQHFSIESICRQNWRMKQCYQIKY